MWATRRHRAWAAAADTGGVVLRGDVQADDLALLAAPPSLLVRLIWAAAGPPRLALGLNLRLASALFRRLRNLPPQSGLGLRSPHLAQWYQGRGYRPGIGA